MVVIVVGRSVGSGVWKYSRERVMVRVGRWAAVGWRGGIGGGVEVGGEGWRCPDE